MEALAAKRRHALGLTRLGLELHAAVRMSAAAAPVALVANAVAVALKKSVRQSCKQKGQRIML